jgi:hypothetical protein
VPDSASGHFYLPAHPLFLRTSVKNPLFSVLNAAFWQKMTENRLGQGAATDTVRILNTVAHAVPDVAFLPADWLEMRFLCCNFISG